MVENKLKVEQRHKDAVKNFSLTEHNAHVTSHCHAAVEIKDDDSAFDGTVKVSIDDQWLTSDDALELSAFFKRLAHLIHKRQSQKED